MKTVSRSNLLENPFDGPMSNEWKGRQEYNLLNRVWIRKLIEWRGFPYSFQLLMLLTFVGLILIGWRVYAPDSVDDKWFAKTNPTTLVIWGIWWPLMVWLAVIMGRVWCMICPLELVSNLTERVSRKIGIQQRALPLWIRSGALVVFLYALIQLLVAGIHLHRVPAYTSFFLIGLLTISAGVGLLFKDRAFCRGFCPIGMLLNAYGRGGMIAVRASSGSTCLGCTGKDCIMACNRNNPDKRSCPSLLNPQKLNSNKDCLVCGQCIKSCQPDNMQLLIRRPFDKTDAREEKASWALTIFIILVSGFVTSELTTEWKAAHALFVRVPDYVTGVTRLTSIGGFIEGFWTIVIFPLLAWILLGFMMRLARGAESLTEAWRKLALPLVVIISAGHLTKAVAKLNTWTVYLPDSFKNIYTQNTPLLNAQPAIMTGQAVSLIGLTLLSIAFLLSIRELSMRGHRRISRWIPGMLLYLFYCILVMGIGWA